MTQMIDAAANPVQANQMIKKILDSTAEVEENTEPEQYVPEIDPPASTVFDLLGGHVLPNGEVVTEVEIRELTGRDEEAIAKSTTVAATLQTVLVRGSVRVGEEKATESTLDSLLAGDRDWMLLHIYAVTFGRKITLTPYCASCAKRVSTTLDILTDVPVRRLDSAYDRSFVVECKSGPVNVTLPDGVSQRAMLAASQKSVAELTTSLLAKCVTRVNDLAVFNEAQVVDLPIADRRKITDEIFRRQPGPLLQDITTPCPECSTELEVPLATVDLFQFQ